MTSRPYRRRNYFTHKGFQSRFIFRFVAVATAGSALTVAIFNIFAYRRIEELLYSTHISVQSTGEAVFEQLLYVNTAAIAFLIVAVYFTLRAILWRVSGPLFRMKKDIQKVADGDFSAELVLRRNDEFQEVASHLRAMVDTLRSLFVQVRRDHETLREALHQLDRETLRGREGATAAAQVFTERARRLRDTLDSVRSS